jgi:hypothetical protein
MSMIGTTAGLLGSASGTPLSQSSSAAGGGIQKEAAALERRSAADEKAELAGGIGQTEEDEEADERDADGRRLWERSRRGQASPDARTPGEPLSKDTTGQAGNALDLVG